MAAETKLQTVLPGNTLKFAENFTPLSEVYAEKINCKGPLENYTIANDVQLTLNTYNWGATATTQIPKMYKFLNSIFLKLKVRVDVTLTAPGSGATTAVNFFPFKAQQFIGNSLLQQLRYKIPGAEAQVFLGENIPTIFMDQCQEVSQRDEILAQSGYCQNSYMTTPVEASPVSKTLSKDFIFFVYLPLPCTDLKDIDRKSKPLPLHLLGDSIDLLTTFRQMTEVMETTAIGSVGSWTVGIPTASITYAEVNFVYTHLGAPAEYKQVVYKFPFSAKYDSIFPIADGVAGTVKQVVLSGLRNGESTTLIIRVAKPGAEAFDGVRMDNLKITYGGYTLWGSNDGNQQIYETLLGKLPNHHAYQGEVGGLVHNYWYHIPFAAILEHVKGAHDYTLGADFQNAELRLSFTLPDTAVTSANYNLYIQNNITSIYQFNGESAALIQ